MSIWQQLGIDATDDVKTIKRAYAKQVKLNRPEDDAQAFQQLHSAYKDALAQAKSQNRVMPDMLDDASVATFDDEQASDLQAQTQVQPDSELDSTITLEQAQQREAEQAQRLQQQEQQRLEQLAYQAELDDLSQKVRRQIKDLSLRDNLNRWQFLLESPYILDPVFNEDLACLVWRGIYQFKLDYLQAQRDAGFETSALVDTPIQIATIAFLDDIFNWRNKAYFLAQQISDEAVEALLDCLDQVQERDSRQRQALAVRGGHIVDTNDTTKLEAKITAETELTAEEQADKVWLRAHYIVCGILFILTTISSIAYIALFASWFKSETTLATEPLILATVIVTYFGALFTGALMRKRWALHLSWPVGIAMLFAFPLGIFFGLSLMWHLPKAAKRYH